MASPLNAAASIGVELEKVRSSVWPQFQQDDTFYALVPDRTDELDVSDRLARIPILVSPGSQFSQIDPDGQSMGVGAGEEYQDGVTTPVYFVQACQVTKRAEWTTDSKEKSVVDVFKESFKFNLRQFRSNVEALMSSSDGSGTLGTVVSAATAGQLTVTNANNFQAKNTYQVWSALGGTNRGTITVLTVDSVNNILYLTAAAPAGTTANDLLIIQGVSGSANTSLNGIPAINLSSSTGQWFGIPRASYPGVLSTPYYAAGTNPLTPQIIMLLESLMQRATGIKTEDIDEIMVHGNVEHSRAARPVGSALPEVLGPRSLQTLRAVRHRRNHRIPAVWNRWRSRHGAGVLLRAWPATVHQPRTFRRLHRWIDQADRLLIWALHCFPILGEEKEIVELPEPEKPQGLTP